MKYVLNAVAEFTFSQKPLMCIISDNEQVLDQFLDSLFNEAKEEDNSNLQTIIIPASEDLTLDELELLLFQENITLNLPTFTKPESLNTSLSQLDQLEQPLLLVLEQAETMPPQTLAILYQLAHCQKPTAIKLHILLSGKPSIKQRLALFLNQNELQELNCYWLQPMPEINTETPTDLATEPKTIWQQHKIKIVSIALLVILFILLQTNQNKLFHLLNTKPPVETAILVTPPAVTPKPKPVVAKPTPTLAPKPKVTHAPTIIKTKKIEPKIKAHYSIQIASFKKQQDANHFIQKHQLQQAFVQHQQIKQQHWFEVMLGQYASYHEAHQALLKLKHRTSLRGAWVKPLPVRSKSSHL